MTKNPLLFVSFVDFQKNSRFLKISSGMDKNKIKIHLKNSSANSQIIHIWQMVDESTITLLALGGR